MNRLRTDDVIQYLIQFEPAFDILLETHNLL